MKKINEITFADLYNNQDLCMDILLGLYDKDIKKSKKANKKVVAPVIEEKIVVSIEEQKSKYL